MVTTAWKIQGEQGRGDPPHGYRIQGDQLKGQGAEHTGPGRLGLTAVSIKISQIINFFFLKCSLTDMDWGIRIVQEACWVPRRMNGEVWSTLLVMVDFCNQPQASQTL